MEITSTPKNTTAASGIYIADKTSGERVIVNDDRLTTVAAVEIRARAELLKRAYRAQRVRLVAPPGTIEVGDVVRVSAPRQGVPERADLDRFIVESVAYEEDGENITMQVQAVRYDR